MSEALAERGGTDRVELVVPADAAYLAVLRTATAGLAARLDLTLDEIEDLRIAVDEACALVLGEPPHEDGRPCTGPLLSSGSPGDGTDDGTDGPLLRATFELLPHELVVQVSGPATDLPDRSSFAWAVLEALVGSLETGTDGDGRCAIRLRHGGTRRAP